MNYDETNIRVLEAVEAIRLRSGMYIGSVDQDGVQQLFNEIVFNARDEFIVNNQVAITIHLSDDLTTISIQDNGRGLPISFKSEFNKWTPELILTTLHSGGKFDKNSYNFASGLHGVGLIVTSALSSKLCLISKRENKKYTQNFYRGIPEKPDIIDDLSPNTGTTIIFTPDEQIFGELHFDIEHITRTLNQLVCLNKGLIITLIHGDKTTIYQNGKFTDLLNNTKQLTDYLNIDFHSSQYKLNAAIKYDNTFGDTSGVSFVNNIHTSQDGSHVNLVRSSWNSFFIKYFEEHLKETISINDVKLGLCTIVSLEIDDPMFSGQTKQKFTTSLSKFNLHREIQDFLYVHLLQNIQLLKHIINKIKQNKKHRLHSEEEIDGSIIKTHGLIDSAFSPETLAECTSKNFEERELFIVEGDSAGGTARYGRNKKNQAVLSLRGKFPNAGKIKIHKLIKNKEILSIFQTIGIDFKNLENKLLLRYNKIIVLTDADADGAHIENLFITLIFHYAKWLIDDQHFYIAQPPLYALSTNKHETIKYFSNMDELKEFKELYKGNTRIVRFKGLGEMNADQLWNTTLNPLTRRLIQIKIDNLDNTQKEVDNIMGIDSQFRRGLTLSLFDENQNE